MGKGKADRSYRVFAVDALGKQHALKSAWRDAISAVGVSPIEYPLFLSAELALLVALEAADEYPIVRVVEIGQDVVVAELRSGKAIFPPDLAEQTEDASVGEFAVNLRVALFDSGKIGSSPHLNEDDDEENLGDEEANEAERYGPLMPIFLELRDAEEAEDIARVKDLEAKLEELHWKIEESRAE